MSFLKCMDKKKTGWDFSFRTEFIGRKAMRGML